jgi:hypothetical protein
LSEQHGRRAARNDPGAGREVIPTRGFKHPSELFAGFINNKLGTQQVPPETGEKLF